MRTQVVQARRWLADPPGPPRDAPPETASERWLTGRRLALAAVGSGVLAVLAGLVIGLVSGT